MGEIRKHLNRATIDHPEMPHADLPNLSVKRHPRAIDVTKREEVRFLIMAGIPHREVVRRSGISGGTVSAIRQELKASMPLYRNTNADICVPNACPTVENEVDEDDVLLQPLEKIGGPGGTRTPDNTVMSGAF
jgi:hypothetical protein